MRFLGPISLLILIAAVPFIELLHLRRDSQESSMLLRIQEPNHNGIICMQCQAGEMVFFHSEYPTNTSFRLYCSYCGKSEVFRFAERLDSLSGFPHHKLVLYRKTAAEEWKAVLNSDSSVGFWA
jgi:hypothetical protein